MPTKDKILLEDQLDNQISNWKNNNQSIVFSNGCFDILHLGHIDYLEKAKALGDKLIIGINTDASVHRLKGETRPVVEAYSRARMLAALEFVDGVTFFDEDTPYNLICKIVPHVLVKGNDYKIDNIVGADIVIKNGGKVDTIELVPGFSTSRIIEKIKKIN